MRQVRRLFAEAFATRIAGLLGVPLPVALHFTAAARARLPGLRYHVRAAAFLLATTRAGTVLLPRSVRERAIQALVGQMIASPSLNMIYLGREPLPAPPR
jgi:hypothetical protein